MSIFSFFSAISRKASQILTKPSPKFSRLCPVTRINFLSLNLYLEFIKDKILFFSSSLFSILSIVHKSASMTVLPLTIIFFESLPSFNRLSLASAVGAK